MGDGRISSGVKVEVLEYGRRSRYRVRIPGGLACALVGLGLLAMFVMYAVLCRVLPWRFVSRISHRLEDWHVLVTAVMLLLAGGGACVLGWLDMGREKGWRAGCVALLLGIVETGLGGFGIYGVTHPYRSGGHPQYTCLSVLTEISVRLSSYSVVHDGRFPDRLEDVTNGRTITCPTNRQGHPAPYIYLGKGFVESFGPTASLDRAIIVMYEPLSNHGDGIHVVFGWGGEEWIPKGEAEDLLKQLEQWEKTYGREAFLWAARSDATPRATCNTLLNQLSVLLDAYAWGHGGRLPAGLEELADGREYPKGMHFTCPTDRPSHPTPYIYLGIGLSKPLDPSTVLIYEPLSDHGDGIHVMYGNLSVEWLPRPEAEELLRRLATGALRPGR